MESTVTITYSDGSKQTFDRVTEILTLDKPDSVTKAYGVLTQRAILGGNGGYYYTHLHKKVESISMTKHLTQEMRCYLEIENAVKTCPRIGEFFILKDSGHSSNRVITCREDVRDGLIEKEKQVLAIFVPGICIDLHPDGTWTATPDGDN